MKHRKITPEERNLINGLADLEMATQELQAKNRELERLGYALDTILDEIQMRDSNEHNLDG
jgi:hypothetical protein